MSAAFDPKTWVENHVLRIAQSSFQIVSDTGLVIAIDPFSPSPKWSQADMVLVTHNHPDHFNPEVVRSLLKEGTRVVVPASVRASGGDRGLATDGLVPGETKVVGEFTLGAVRAYNLRLPVHQRSKDWLGYLFAVDGLTLYYAGDTDLIPEISQLRADVVFLPAGGLFTMNAKKAAEAARILGAKVAVPMHYGMLPLTGKAGRQFAAFRDGITVLL